MQQAIEVSFRSETVRNGFRVCGLFPFDENAVDYSKCISGKKKSELSVPSINETAIPVSRELLEEIIQQISPAQAALYRELDVDFFTVESERIVCKLYKGLLQPLDQRVINEKSSDEPDLSYEQMCDNSDSDE